MADEPAKGAKSEDRIDREVLIAEAHPRLGVSSFVLAGALSDSTAKTFTEDQAKRAVDKFLKREVETEGEPEPTAEEATA